MRLSDTGTNMAHLPIAVHEVDHWHLWVTSADFQARLNSVATRPKSGLVVAQCRRANYLTKPSRPVRDRGWCQTDGFTDPDRGRGEGCRRRSGRVLVSRWLRGIAR